jgi:lipopolysaccharide/colanic/teichoic acid biosynthesis glycosyltransferase
VAKRLFDIIGAALGLLLSAPVLLVAAVGIRLSSRGPILYRAQRVGRGGKPFTMHKFRTMRVEQGPGACPVTGPNDARVFRFGSLLRLLKIDELPQLYDVLRGKMSLVGPRPEDPRIVRDYYTPQQRETLRVRPGMTSPGSLYNYTHGDQILRPEDPEQAYVARLLPVKLALEGVYVREASFWYDLRLLFRTAWVILQVGLGRQHFPDPPEMREVLPEAATVVRQPQKRALPTSTAREPG